jgi:Tfp pilus assembly protein FimT
MLEMLLVMAIIGIVVAIAAPRYGEAGASRKLEAAKQETQKQLRSARAKAIAHQTAKVIRFYPSLRQIEVDGKQVTLPAEARLVKDTSGQSNEMRFYPDGSVDRRVILLQSEKASLRLATEWFSGKLVELR